MSYKQHAMRRKFIWMLFIFFVFISLICPQSPIDYRTHWYFIAGTTGTMLIIDYMFMDDDAFIYEPDHDNWKNLTERGNDY